MPLSLVDGRESGRNILGIVGSPRRNGNTDILVNKILEGARSASAVTDIIHLDEMEIMQCDGCHRCWGEGNCRWKDDMLSIYEKIAGCDVLVLGTPIYWFGPSAMMKACLDRFVYFNSPHTRPMVKGKVVILAIPFEDTDLGTADPLVAMFERSLEYLEMDLFAMLLVPGVTRRGEVKERQEQMDLAFEVGRDSVSDPRRSNRLS
jgi:multimeric flavodoxin WrbA